MWKKSMEIDDVDQRLVKGGRVGRYWKWGGREGENGERDGEGRKGKEKEERRKEREEEGGKEGREERKEEMEKGEERKKKTGKEGRERKEGTCRQVWGVGRTAGKWIRKGKAGKERRKRDGERNTRFSALFLNRWPKRGIISSHVAKVIKLQHSRTRLDRVGQ
jgi:hypothetical protein